VVGLTRLEIVVITLALQASVSSTSEHAECFHNQASAVPHAWTFCAFPTASERLR
jgi:hypothetical protein